MNDDTQNFVPDSAAIPPARNPPIPQETAEIAPPADSATADLPPSPVPASDPSATASFVAPASPTDGSPDAATVDQAIKNDPGATTEQSPEARPTKRSGPAPAPVSIAGYEILGTLGRGAMGVVYKARQRGLRRVVALKMILAGDHADERELARFQSEAEAVAQLQHPNIVQLYEVGEYESKPYFSLEFVPGGSLADKLKGEPQPPKKAAAILRTLAQAMGYAHLHGVIHRDLKPANVLMTEDGLPKVTDFGLAKRVEDGSAFTQDGTILGTPSYMAPEQAEGRINEINALSDVYSLGAMLYEMLTGRPPFKGTSIWETVELVRTKEPVPPSQLQPGVPRDLETICLKCLQKEAAKRYGSADELADDLERFLTGEAIHARPVSSGERLWRWCRRNPRITALGVVAIFLVLLWAGTASGMYFQIRAEKAETEIQREEAVAKKKLAQENEIKANYQKDLADKRAIAANEKADLARKLFVASIDNQIALIRKMNSELRAKPGEKPDPRLTALRDQLVALARKQMTQQGKDIESAKLSDYAQVLVNQRLGDIFKELGDAEEARAQYQHGYDQLRLLIKEDERDAKAVGNLAVMAGKLGDATLEAQGDPATAAAFLHESHTLQKKAVALIRERDEPPAKKKEALDEAESRLVSLLWRIQLASRLAGDPPKSELYYRGIYDYWKERVAHDPANQDARSYLSLACCLLAEARSLQGDANGARIQAEEATRLCTALIAEKPSDATYPGDLAFVEGVIGDTYQREGNVEEALKHYRLHLGTLQNLARKPRMDFYVSVLTETYERIGQTSLRTDGKTAEEFYKKALAIRLQLARAKPEVLGNRIALCLALARGGSSADALQQVNDLLQNSPRHAEVRICAARTYAVCARRCSDSPEKQELTQKAITRVEELVKGGYRDFVTLETDPDFDALRDEPAFRALIPGR